MNNYSDYFSDKSDHELVNIFNRETSHNGWVSQRAIFLNDLFKEFESRKIGLGEIKGELEGHTTFSLQYPVFMDEKAGIKKMVQITKKWMKMDQNVK